MISKQNLEHVTNFLPAPVARVAKRVGVYPRYLLQAYACRQGYRRFGDRYPQKLLFIAGLPKSGTTWLEKMAASYSGFHNLLIPDVSAYEMATGASHDYDLPADMFSRFDEMLVITKMHVHGSVHNASLLHAAGLNYVILYRDLRDVALSHYYYVRQTRWHPDYRTYSTLSLSDGLTAFSDRLLLPFAEWVRSWHANRDPERGLVVRYEDLVADTPVVLARIAGHFELDSSHDTMDRIVEEHRFDRLSRGRHQGEESQKSFFRKGVAGDWRNHFTPRLKEIYKNKIGKFLIDFGYEQDDLW